MSAHPSTTEASSPVSAEAVQDFIADQFLGGADPAPEEEEEEIPEGEEPEGEPEAEESAEADETTDEAVEPIKPPVSWDGDAKELFAQLPPELQSKVAEREAQREKLVQQRTTEAANAKRDAVAEANAALAEDRRKYAAHLEQIVGQFAPQPPDPALAAQDPAAYVQHKAIYDAQAAQHQRWLQQMNAARVEADQRDNLTRQHEVAKVHETMAAELGEEWTDTSRRQELLTNLEKVGAEIGYPKELILEANATDLLALRRAAEWKAKAEKYDSLQKDKMVAVRAAKGLPKVAKPGVASSRAEQGARSKDAAWQQVKASRGRSGDASAAYLESIGIKL